MPPLYHEDSFPITKCCTHCHQIKTVDDFYKSGSQISSRCKKCITDIQKQQRLLKNTIPAIQRPLFVLSKVCPQCHIEKPIEAFNRCGGNSTGYQCYCKECQYLYSRRTEDSRFRRGDNYTVPTSKACITCHIVKPLDDFPRKSMRRDRRDSQCKACKRDYKRQRRLNNPEWARTQDHRPRVPAKVNKEKRQRRHACYRMDPTWVEQRRAYGRAWAKANPLKLLERGRRRVALMKGTIVGKVDYQRVLKRDGYWCYICEGDILSHHTISFDHRIPIVPLRGSGRVPGPHIEENIHPVHDICNYRKGNRLLEEMSPFLRRGPDV